LIGAGAGAGAGILDPVFVWKDMSGVANRTLGTYRRVGILSEPPLPSKLEPMVVEKQSAVFFAVTTGLMDNVPVEKIQEFEARMIEYIEAKDEGALRDIRERKEMTEELSERLTKLINDFKDTLEYIEK
jgi:F-type H+-transporting ATPase subunit alpha